MEAIKFYAEALSRLAGHISASLSRIFHLGTNDGNSFFISYLYDLAVARVGAMGCTPMPYIVTPEFTVPIGRQKIIHNDRELGVGVYHPESRNKLETHRLPSRAREGSSLKPLHGSSQTFLPFF